ncbi:hypothetical protein NQ318_009232 [Aromia moschata]|uniref:Transposase n=1 Tax=Aromia moschata TaxID=1265417 RepID=A0AAV8Y9N8_9CUCU|nr:hypothetical protein NQ318_009232 [Aromia moschata]
MLKQVYGNGCLSHTHKFLNGLNGLKRDVKRLKTIRAPDSHQRQKRSVMEIDRFVDEEWKHFVAFSNKFCKVATKFLSHIAAEFEKAAGLTATCPYPKGEYKVSNVPLDFEKLDYSMVPRGRVKAKASIKDETGKILICESVEFTVTD